MNICVFGAAGDPPDALFTEEAFRLGRALALRGHALIFGGGDTGLMGAVARGTHAGGGHVTGIAPRFFDKPGILYPDCDEMIYTETMHERKALMEARADAFIMTPGGIGTYEEFFEVLTLKQLDQHVKAIGVLNTKGYFDPLMALIRNAVREGFFKEKSMTLFAVESEPEVLLDALSQ